MFLVPQIKRRRGNKRRATLAATASTNFLVRKDTKTQLIEKRNGFMSKKSVLCIATSRKRAEQIIANLRSARFSSKDLSVVFPDPSFLREPGAEKDTPNGERSVASRTEVEEVALAWPGEIGTLLFADFGRFTAAGPLLAALGGVAMSEADGGMAASLICLGVPAFEARQYESRMKDGNILIGVHLEELGSIAPARGILAESYGENICIVDLAPAKGVMSVQPGPWQG